MRSLRSWHKDQSNLIETPNQTGPPEIYKRKGSEEGHLAKHDWGNSAE